MSKVRLVITAVVVEGHPPSEVADDWHLSQHHQLRVSPATISRYLSAAGLVTPQPRKRPRSTYIRFQAEQPNECWRADFTHYRLADGTGCEVLTWLDDHSRYALSVAAHRRVTGPIVLATFRETAGQHGIPASTLTDIRCCCRRSPPSSWDRPS